MQILKGIYWASLLLSLSAMGMLAYDVWFFTGLIFDRCQTFHCTSVSRVIQFDLDFKFEQYLEFSMPKRRNFLSNSRIQLPEEIYNYMSRYHLDDDADRNELTIGPTLRLAFYRNRNSNQTVIDDARDQWGSSLEKLVVVVDRAKLRFPPSDFYSCSEKLFSGGSKRTTAKMYRKYFPLAISPTICSYLFMEPRTEYTISDVLELMRSLDNPMRFDLLRIAYWFFYLEEHGNTYSSLRPVPEKVLQLVWDRLKNCPGRSQDGKDLGCVRDVKFDGSLMLDTSKHLLETFWIGRKAPDSFEQNAERYIYAPFKGNDQLFQLHFFLAISGEPIIVTVPAAVSDKVWQEIEDFTRGAFLLDGTAPLVTNGSQGWWEFYWANLVNAMKHYRIAIGRQGISVWTVFMLMIVATSARITWRGVKKTVISGTG
jgi:hypothetical protein